MSDAHEVILLPAGGRYTCDPGQSLLDAALAAGYWLPHGCRSGSCGLCALPVASGAVLPMGEPAANACTPPAGHCLTCRSTPASVVTLEAPSVGAQPGVRVISVGARVLEVSRPSADVAVLRLQLPPNSGFNFKPGQYMDIVLRDGARRSYSMANVPDDSGLVEFHVRRIPGGRFSAHAYDKLKARDMLRVEGPFGSFALSDSDVPIVFLASGTGYAPIASMLASHRERIRMRGAKLYWGGRKLGDLYGLVDLQAWHDAHPGVELIPVLSDPEEGWAGRRGLVHEAVLADHADLKMREVYACGNPMMINAAQSSFCEQRGLLLSHFFSDAFVAK